MQTVTAAKELPIGPDASQADASQGVAEQIHQGKRLKGVEEEIVQLTNASGLQMQVVSKLEESLRSCISESELRRAIGLAFQEFETRLNDAFQESNRKFLNLFAKKEEVSEVHSAVGKKVNWGEYHHVLGKLAELRSYIDTAAETVFIGHRDALHGEFARKADAATVDMALKSKADLAEVNDLRARLERLEMLLSHAGTVQSARLDELRDDMNAKLNQNVKQLAGQIKEHADLIKGSLEHQKAQDEQLTGCAGSIGELGSSSRKLFEITGSHGRVHEDHKGQITQIKDLIDGVNAIARKNRKVLDDAVAELKEVNRGSEQRFGEISQKEKILERQLEFLMQASEASKRKVKEMGKSLGKTCTGLASDTERCAEAIATCEAQLRSTEHKLRAIQDEGGGGGGGGLAGLLSSGRRRDKSPPPSPNRHLAGVLEQLQAIVSEDIFVKRPPEGGGGGPLSLPAPAPPGVPSKDAAAAASMAALSGALRGGGNTWPPGQAAAEQIYRNPAVPPLPKAPSSVPSSARGAGGGAYGGNSARGGRPR